VARTKASETFCHFEKTTCPVFEAILNQFNLAANPILQLDTGKEKPMILSSGSKVLIVHRRLFEDDHPRFFVGQIDAYENGIAKVTGFTFAFDIFDGHFDKKIDQRTKIFSITSGNVFFYELPRDVKIPNLKFEHERHFVHLIDGAGFKMDLSENYRAPIKVRN
jgi:hypothetical protein